MKRGAYLFPTLLTLANLGAGVMSILLASTGHFTQSAWAIIVGIVMDMSDGRIARWLGATSQFGLELDSLADLTTFGVAPAILMYQMALVPLGRPAFMLVAFFSMTAALRLARFNLRAVQTAEPVSHFIGLPVPAAAGILASFVLSYELFGNTEVNVKTIPVLMKQMPIFFRTIPVVMLILSFLMISTVHYGDFKKLKLGRPKSLQSLATIAAGILLIVTYPQNTIFIVFSLYVLSGLLMFSWRTFRARRDRLAASVRRRATDRPEDYQDPASAPWNQRK
jgi:CDP-diacylglycerol--serine O-phosphatidyltransferase